MTIFLGIKAIFCLDDLDLRHIQMTKKVIFDSIPFLFLTTSYLEN